MPLPQVQTSSILSCVLDEFERHAGLIESDLQVVNGQQRIVRRGRLGQDAAAASGERVFLLSQLAKLPLVLEQNALTCQRSVQISTPIRRTHRWAV